MLSDMDQFSYTSQIFMELAQACPNNAIYTAFQTSEASELKCSSYKCGNFNGHYT